MLKLKNSNGAGIVVDGSLLKDIITRIGVGGINIGSPNVGTFEDNDENDVCHHHLAGPLFWVQMLESYISKRCCWILLMVKRNFISYNYSAGGGVASSSAAADMSSAKATSERRRQRRTTTGSRHWAAARDRVRTTK
jgi:hypothetical protein